MDVLVIGGTLDFGRVTVRRLLDRGDRVTIYSRGNARPDFWNDVDHIIDDRTDRAGFAANLKGRQFDAVVDNVAYRVEDVRAVVDALRGNVGKYLVSTTVSVYGAPGHSWKWRTARDKPGPPGADEFVDLAANCPIREDSIDLSTVSWDYDPGRDAYAEGKRQMERYLSETPDFPWVVMRIPSVLGPAEPALRFYWYLQRILDGREMILRDGGSGVFRPGFRDDVSGAFVGAIDSPNTANNIYNITGAEIVTLRHFLEVIAAQAGCELNTVSIPGDVVELASDLPYEDWWYDFFSRPSVYVPSIERARCDFGLKTTPLEKWVGETVAWYLENPPKGPPIQEEGVYTTHYELRDKEVELCERWRKEYGDFAASFTGNSR